MIYPVSAIRLRPQWFVSFKDACSFMRFVLLHIKRNENVHQNRDFRKYFRKLEHFKCGQVKMHRYKKERKWLLLKSLPSFSIVSTKAAGIFSDSSSQQILSHNLLNTIFWLSVINSHMEIQFLVAQPRPQGLLAFQNGGGSGEDPGTQ